MPAPVARASLVALVALVLGACSTYRDDLDRGVNYYKENAHTKALATWRLLEPDIDSLEPKELTRYAYYRGMTDYRLEFRADARHWLAVARELEKQNPGGLEGDDQKRLEEALDDLNGDYYVGKERKEKSRSSAEVTDGQPTEGEGSDDSKPKD
jgi:hypothetical protein